VRSGWGEIFDRDAKAGEAGGAEVEVPDTREKRPKVANSLRSLLGAQFVRQVHGAGEPGRGAATDHQARGQHASLQPDRLHLRHGVRQLRGLDPKQPLHRWSVPVGRWRSWRG
jgi:hypothetical protein